MAARTILSTIRGITLPAAEGPHWLSDSPERLTIEFGEGAPAYMLTGDNTSRTFATVFERLMRSGNAAYVEVDENDNVSAVHLPEIDRVESISESAEFFAITLSTRQRVFGLAKTATNAQDLLQQLQRAFENHTLVAVVVDASGDILDVKPPPQKVHRPAVTWQFTPLADLPEGLPEVVSLDYAHFLFDGLQTYSCQVKSPAGCIPYLFPDDGCWARAHMMCSLLLKYVRPRKQWFWTVPGPLLCTPTLSHPNCAVKWRYHVAPSVYVKTSAGDPESYVLDPSMFNLPVMKDDWARAQHPPDHAKLFERDARLFFWNPNTGETRFDDNLDETHQLLDQYASTLIVREKEFGVPPYSYCQGRPNPCGN